MLLRKWEDLPDNMRNESVRPYYDYLQSKKFDLFLKFVFDKVVSLFLLIFLSPIFLIIAYKVKRDSPGPVFFRQERVTHYGKVFYIYKFRTMVENAEKLGTQVTTKRDLRITAIGKQLRRCRLDELPQLINILKGEMSFVGTRPEVVKYVKQYTPEMMATLLLRAGVTSDTSIEYINEENILAKTEDVDTIYIKTVLPQKMQWNLKSLSTFNFIDEVKTMIKTIGAVL